MERESLARPEEMLRLLASAADAARLYPPASELPRQAVARFVTFANATTSASGPVRFTIDPHGFRLGEREIAGGVSHVVSLAEALHRLQSGQLIVAPDLTDEETATFLATCAQDPQEVRSAGGLRAALGAAGVARIAVIEVSLRASSEEGLLGVDLAAAPLDEIAEETAAAADRWARAAASGQAVDEMAASLESLEEATRDIAMQRVAQALLRLDEPTRERVLAASLAPAPGGERMKGMLGVVARMNPAALARLLALTAARVNAAPERVAMALDLPPEALKMVMELLKPSPRSEADCGVPPDVDTSHMAADIAETDDRSDLDRQIAISAPALASGKRLVADVRLSHKSPDLDTVTAIGHALPGAARDGALVEVREALRRLDELREDPVLTEAVDRARATLADPVMLRDLCRAPLTDADAAVAGEILSAAGPAGAQALLEVYLHTDEFRRSLMRPVLRGMSDQVLSVAGRMLRTADTQTAAAVLGTLSHLGDRRVLPVIATALENVDVNVRAAALRALADTRLDEAVTALEKALGHWDPASRRHAARELGRICAESAVPALSRVLDRIQLFERNYELKKEVIASLEAIGSAKALPALRRIAKAGWPFGRKRKELRFLARNAMARLEDRERGRQ
ncbi:MAG: HEAT repeat domain-containing protein [Actinobacteria bacterium]|nr:MAG: HEAT repeat domain-containing protein [Actinomycetota bacterium]